MAPAVAWRIMAASGGHPVDLSVRFDGAVLEPLTVTSEGQYISVVAIQTGKTTLAG